MQEVFEKIIEKLEELKKAEIERDDLCDEEGCGDGEEIYEDGKSQGRFEQVVRIIEIVKQEAEKYNNGWIPCNKEMPPVETEVFILAKRKFKDGTCSYIVTMAMYEDGAVSECDSCWVWEDIEGEYDEENDCYIIPEGWWESRKYNTIDALNFAVDDEVIAWQPMPQEYQENGERQKKTNFDMCCESIEAMAQIIDIEKIGWTKDQIMEWLKKEACAVPD